MDNVAAILVGLAAGLLLARVSNWHSSRLKKNEPAASHDEPSKSAATGAPNQSAPATLAERLHTLEGAFAPFASASAHPSELGEHPQFKEAAGLLADSRIALQTVMQYAQGANWPLACAAFAALNAREDRVRAIEQMMAHFDKVPPWPMYFALIYILGVEPRPPVGAPLIGAKDWWRDNPVLPLIFRDYFARRAAFGDAAEFGPALASTAASPPAVIRSFLERVNHPLATALMQRLDAIQKMSVDRAFLSSFGRFWSEGNETDVLIEPDNWRAPFGTAESTLTQTPMRSLLVSGEPLVGKTAFLRLLATRVAKHGWSVFEASGADLMAGQIWFGQLEGRIRQAIGQLSVDKKLIWYIPDLLQLARSGTHQGQSASILDQMLPAMSAGRLVIWTEAVPTSAARLIQLRPALRGLFEMVRLEPHSEKEASALARLVANRLSEKLKMTIDPDCADVAIASARQYLNAASLPGSALMLLNLTAGRADMGDHIGKHDVLKTLSQLSGIPVSILDNKERIELISIRRFFASRVIGQDEAVASIVDRIVMLKAGLNDPGKPIGVFLFAGPTGTGKTELAKTAAEYLFGSADRLIRLDMSEFQTWESVTRIVGESNAVAETDSLINRVRKQPFSVVLLDEFEKSHPRIWDLFLQVFDEGRLSDTLGHIADFRHCLIILTTNLGATSHQSAGLGFAPPADVFATDQIVKAISQTYRPEFQNRLDKIIVFRPLTREMMREILRKELSHVLARRGLKDRDWAVEWESSALEFLLEKGFSPEMGARPVKRAIDEYVVAPLAATIVERRFPEGDQFVFFRSDGQAIQAEFVDPDADAPSAVANPDAKATVHPSTFAAMILAPHGSAAEAEALAAETSTVRQTFTSPEWEDLKQNLSDQMSTSDFWERPERYERLARLALMDRVAAAAETAEALRVRLRRGVGRPGHYSRELISRLALQVYLVKEGIKDVFEDSPIEVALLIEPSLETLASDRRATDAWCRQLLVMYRAWSKNRNMQVAEMAPRIRELPILLITGFGAHRVLARERGLHILELGDPNGGLIRVAARVSLAVPPLGEIPTAKQRRVLGKAIDSAPRSSAVVRRYRGEPAALVRNADGAWRTGKLDAVLSGDFDLLAMEPP